jgi:hypothetical protein
VAQSGGTGDGAALDLCDGIMDALARIIWKDSDVQKLRIVFVNLP